MSSAGRGRGGKFSKPKRGGGKHFSRDTLPTNRDGEQVSMWADKEDIEGSEDDSSEESSSSDEGGPSAAQQAQPELTREERRAAKKARKGPNARSNAQEPGAGNPRDSSGEENGDGDLPANPNHTNKAARQAAETPVVEAEAVKTRRAVKNGDMENLSRREREAIEKERAKERYEKLHREGKTDEAKADLERLALVRERREAEAARKKAEKEEKEEHERQKKAQMERDERNRALKSAKATRGKKNNKKEASAES